MGDILKTTKRTDAIWLMAQCKLGWKWKIDHLSLSINPNIEAATGGVL